MATFCHRNKRAGFLVCVICAICGLTVREAIKEESADCTYVGWELEMRTLDPGY